MKTKRFSVPMVATLFLAAPALSSYTMAADELVSPLRGSDKGNCQFVHAVMEKLVVMECPTFDFCFTRELADPSGV